MYLLNNDKLKDRNTFWTWLFFNKKLKKDCKESISLLFEDITKVSRVENRAHEIKDIRSELKLADVQHCMQHLYLYCIKAAHTSSRLSINQVIDIVIGLRVLDKILSE